MCGRFTLTIPPELLAEIFGASMIEGLPKRYNIAPTQDILVVRKISSCSKVQFMRWGLVPSWAKVSSVGSRMINARCETVHLKPAFRDSIRKRRCIIPASGFFEWKIVDGKKTPWCVRLKSAGVMGFAGIWDTWKHHDGTAIESCSILTTSASRLLHSLHDRMPVILSPGNYDIWLDWTITDPEELRSLYLPFSDELMECYPVSAVVNNPRNDLPACIEPLGNV